MSICTGCGTPFPAEMTRTGRALRKCPECREAGAARMRLYRANRGEQFNEWQRSYHRRRRRAALDAYGSRCACCGETEREFLTFDHVDGGGTQHRKEVATRGNGFVSWLHANGFPDSIRVLCYNCNTARGHWGSCPHER